MTSEQLETIATTVRNVRTLSHVRKSPEALAGVELLVRRLSEVFWNWNNQVEPEDFFDACGLNIDLSYAPCKICGSYDLCNC